MRYRGVAVIAFLFLNVVFVWLVWTGAHGLTRRHRHVSTPTKGPAATSHRLNVYPSHVQVATASEPDLRKPEYGSRRDGSPPVRIAALDGPAPRSHRDDDSAQPPHAVRGTGQGLPSMATLTPQHHGSPEREKLWLEQQAKERRAIQAKLRASLQSKGSLKGGTLKHSATASAVARVRLQSRIQEKLRLHEKKIRSGSGESLQWRAAEDTAQRERRDSVKREIDLALAAFQHAIPHPGNGVRDKRPDLVDAWAEREARERDRLKNHNH